MIKNYLFLMAWIDGSESALEDNGVRQQEDLLVAFNAGNDNIFSLLITSEDYVPECMLDAMAYKEAFHANYTAHDSLSMMVEITDPDFLKQVQHNLNINKLISIEFSALLIVMEKRPK